MKGLSRQQILLFVTVGILAVFVALKAVYDPLTALWAARGKEVRTLQRQIVRGQQLIKAEPDIRAEWEQMRTNTLPNNQSMAMERISERFHFWAQESGVSVNGVTPQWKSDAEDYKTVVCRVDASGTLWMLSRFIYDIESDPLGLKLESVDFNSHDNTGQQLSLGLQVSGLVLNSPE